SPDALVGAALAGAARPRAASESTQDADSAAAGSRLFGQQGMSGLARQPASARRPPLWLAAAAVGCGWAALYNTASWISTYVVRSPAHEDVLMYYTRSEEYTSELQSRGHL